MSTITHFKQNDRLPEYTATLLQGDGTPIPLSGATVRFLMREAHYNKTVKVDADATIVSALAGEVKYPWEDGDLDTNGEFEVEWEVTFSDGRPMTVPAADYDIIVVGDDIA